MTCRKLNRRELCATALAAAAAPLARAAATIDDFFTAFTDEWVRHDPNLATRTRYFSGDEQDRLESRRPYGAVTGNWDAFVWRRKASPNCASSTAPA